MYNMILGDGMEERRGQIYGLTMLNIPRYGSGRFRDAWVEVGEDGDLRIAIYTRNGGGNRPDYEAVTEALRRHPEYISDKDDAFDSTYATYYFRFPTSRPPHLDGREDWAQVDWNDLLAEVMETAHPEPVDMSAMWKEALDKMQNEGPTDEQMAAFGPIAEQIKNALGDQADGDIEIVVAGRDLKRILEEEQ